MTSNFNKITIHSISNGTEKNVDLSAFVKLPVKKRVIVFGPPEYCCGECRLTTCCKEKSVKCINCKLMYHISCIIHAVKAYNKDRKYVGIVYLCDNCY